MKRQQPPQPDQRVFVENREREAIPYRYAEAPKPKARIPLGIVLLKKDDLNVSAVLAWKKTACPSCGTVNGWRVGAAYCLSCVEWRAMKPMKPRRGQLQKQ